MAQIPNGMLSITYDYSNYHVATTNLLIGSDTYLVLNSSGIYVSDTAPGHPEAVIYPHICLLYNNSYYYCNWGTSPITVTIPPSGSVIPIAELINVCLDVRYVPTGEGSNPTIIFTIYDYYTQKVIYSATWSGPESVKICGVPNIVIVNITYNGQKLGLFYVSTHPPLSKIPSFIAPLSFFLVLALFLALGIRNRPKIMAIGFLMTGIFLIPFISAMHIVGQGYMGALGYLISTILIITGIAILWLGRRTAQWY